MKNYTNKFWPDHRCTHCWNALPTNDRGICRRCDLGWPESFDAAGASDDLIHREIGLASYARDTIEERGRLEDGAELSRHIECMKAELAARG